jgi:hypothetical protein
MEQEYQDMLSWYNEYCRHHLYFKYSFAFIDGLYTELHKRQQTTNFLTYHIDLWFKDLEQIKEHINNLKSMITENLGQEADHNSIQDLLSIKRQLVSWINNDLSQLYKHNVQHFEDGNVHVSDYCLQGEAREKVAYNIYLNHRYLNKIYDYFITCNEFNYLLLSILSQSPIHFYQQSNHSSNGYQGILRNSSHDLTIIMSQDDWDGDFNILPTTNNW